jgi:hypothetical protein
MAPNDQEAQPPKQPPVPEWRSSDPRNDLVDRKRASIVILRPSLTGHHDAGTGHCEMKHGWHISFTGEPGRILENWDPAWLWVLAPTQP